MVELPQAHVCANILAHCNDGYAKRRNSLVKVILLLIVEMVVAMVKERLDLEHIPRPGVRADIDENLRRLADRVLDSFQRLDCCVRIVLLTFN